MKADNSRSNVITRRKMLKYSGAGVAAGISWRTKRTIFTTQIASVTNL
jgi:hypothetical protein